MAKVDAAMASIEIDVKTGRLLSKDVTWTLLSDRAGVGYRYLDAPGQKGKKQSVKLWMSDVLPKLVPRVASSPAEENARLRAEVDDLYRRLDRMGDRIHFYSARIRQQVRTIRALKAKSLETVVHISR
ncbi:hypothetical protein HA459_00470 [Rhizobium leguminosarum bv. trifolii]|uniref:hypothetical protein n=1 Tax=Rhizobium leguminosarum TaxID=384 RepID=UPI00140FFAB7|nr:hypothetical protein [Rhizobium leguminosarum]QIO70581.1 hypothetical protein HA459_00470 [Rhizobium leguminosarum bv. trifolii]QIO77587.1 hypothetical protein HA460_00470 [Rhizobium leguminosarum bv. trifolii]